jgi:hypothetical protein
MPEYLFYAPSQSKVTVVTDTDQLQPVTLQNTIHYSIKHKPDLFIFSPKYHNEETDHSIYNP